MPAPDVVRVPRRPARPLCRVSEVAEVASQPRRRPVVVTGSRAGPGAMAAPTGVVAITELLSRAALVRVVACREHGPCDAVQQRRGRLVVVRAALRDVAGADEHRIAGRGARVAWRSARPFRQPGYWMHRAPDSRCRSAGGWPTEPSQRHWRWDPAVPRSTRRVAPRSRSSVAANTSATSATWSIAKPMRPGGNGCGCHGARIRVRIRHRRRRDRYRWVRRTCARRLTWRVMPARRAPMRGVE